MKKAVKWLLPIMVLCLLVWLFCPGETLAGWEEPEFLPAAARREIPKEILEIAEVCGEWGTSEELSQSGIDAMEKRLIDAGYATVDSDAVYPEYLANPEGLRIFWEDRYAGVDTCQTVLSVGSAGIWYRYFGFAQGEDLFFTTELCWDAEGVPYVRESTSLPVYDIDLTDWGIFYYRNYREDPHYIDYSQLRLTPADRELYDMNRKYILSVGYQFVNLFLCDWQEGEWGTFSFEDVLDYLYVYRTGEAFPWTQYPTKGYPARYLIPAEVFEDSIQPYFRISREELRECCQYDAEENCYLWRPIYGEDITPWKYPFCEPEVLEAAENSDGTLTLRVQVYSPDVKTDNLFTHELTVRPLADGGFQYVANRVTEVSAWGLPPTMPRFELDAA